MITPPISVTMGPGMPPASVPDPVLSLRGTEITWTSMPYSHSQTQPTPVWIASGIAQGRTVYRVFMLSAGICANRYCTQSYNIANRWLCVIQSIVAGRQEDFKYIRISTNSTKPWVRSRGLCLFMSYDNCTFHPNTTSPSPYAIPEVISSGVGWVWEWDYSTRLVHSVLDKWIDYSQSDFEQSIRDRTLYAL